MSVANQQLTHLRALDLNKKEVTADFTIRTGRPADGFVIDNPVELNPTAATAVTLPSGYKMGQEILISFQGGDTTAVTLTVTNHENGDAGTTTMNADDEYINLIWTGTEWATVSVGGCSDIA